MIEATFGEPESCDVKFPNDQDFPGDVADCSACLNDLVKIHRCRADKAYPGSPMVIHSSSKSIDLGMGSNDVLFSSITEYVFQCSRNVAED